MTTARSKLIDLNATTYYHCEARCVRGAFLFGEDEDTGKNYEHRKLWIIERLTFLAALFAIDVCAYAVLSNHLHLMLRVAAQRVAAWTDEEVVRRAGRACPTCVVGLEKWTAERRGRFVETWRERLSSISWFMKLFDEYIARLANHEDGRTGHFWESRFKSQALMDDGALLTSMAYVDLNPVRAGLAEGLDDSSWTSIQQRLREAAASMAHTHEIVEPVDEPAAGASAPQDEPASQDEPAQPVEPRAGSRFEPELRQCPVLAPMELDIRSLFPAEGAPEGGDEAGGRSERLPVTLLQYVALLEWTGRAVREDKRGCITGPPPELLSLCGLDPSRWLESVERFGERGGFVGHPRRLKQRAAEIGQRWLKGQGGSAMAYATAA